MSELQGLLDTLPGPDEGAADAVRTRAAAVLRPTGALARLDEVAAWLGGWQRSARPAVERPTAILFAADHGVTTEGVSAYPATVTPAMVDAIGAGVATSSAMAKTLGVTLEVVDVGVGVPTGNIRHEDAMSAEQFDEAVRAGVDAVTRHEDADLLVFGEMGIGNTTPASAICLSLFGGTAAAWTGPGTGLDTDGVQRKAAVVQDAVARLAGPVPPLDVARRVGGRELAAIAGAVAAARRASIPVVLDGFIVTAAVAPLAEHTSGALDHCIAGHRSAEPGHRRLLEALDLSPLLDLDLRLGEGTGALAAVPLVRLAASVVRDVATFEEWGLR